MNLKNLASEPTLFRAAVVRSSADEMSVDENGGNYGAGVIRNFAVITTGEALGHGMWVDAEFMAHVGEQLSSAAKGVKSRFTHPGMSGDALSKGLGRVEYKRIEGDKLIGDLHFYKSAHKTPDGDLAGHVMRLTREDPEALGASISFTRDPEAEEDYAANYSQSPDPRNVQNLPHVRLGQLRYVDIVDEPAANPDGMFHRDDIFKSGEQLFEYALGLSDIKPEVVFGIEPDRLLGFCTRFLELRGLQIMKLNMNEDIIKEEELSEDVAVEEVQDQIEDQVEDKVEEVEAVEEQVEEVEAVEEQVEESDGQGTKGVPSSTSGHFSKEDLSKYIESFGKDKGLDYFMEGIEFGQAQASFIASQKEDIAKLKQELELSKQTEDAPLSGASGENLPKRGLGFASKIKGQIQDI